MLQKIFSGGVHRLLVLCIIVASINSYHAIEKNDSSSASGEVKSRSAPQPTKGTGSTAGTPATTKSTASTTTKRKRKTKQPESYSDMGYYGNSDEYNYDRDGDRSDRRSDRYGDSDEGMSYGGIDKRKHGQDLYGKKTIRNTQSSMLASLDIWISAADDWEQKGKRKYRGRARKYNGDKDKKDRDYKEKDSGEKKYKEKDSGEKKYKKKDSREKKYKESDDDDKKKNYRDKDEKRKNSKEDSDGDDYKKEGSRKKRSYSRVRFPVRQYRNFRNFPLSRFPPLFSTLPWLPIFYDKITYQTFIFSPTGGIYVLPPLINFYGQRFAVAQLIKWGYASLVSSGIPPPPNVNVAPLVQPVPAGGVVQAGVVGSPGGPAPGFDAGRGRFNGGVKTEFSSFKPRYSDVIYEDDNRSYKSGPRNNYGGDSNYGGTNKQQVYAQGEQRNAGAYGY